MKLMYSKVNAKYQVIIPVLIRDYLRLEAGDTVEFILIDNRVVLRRNSPLDSNYFNCVVHTLNE
jgi:AbrB family looped-hinge helix DNA binding protein